MNIADIFGSVRLNLDTGEFEVSAAKAADRAGADMGSRMGARLKKAAGGFLGASAGAAFGVALSGANQLDAATRQLQADTGMTATEAARAEHAMAGMYRGNLQGFDQIGAAMARVHNDLGLSGAAADAATAKFLKFGTATGQDAAGAVASFDDILDAWNLTAADAGPLMDGLIADHQKFGGAVADSQAALAAMAPAMQAANMSIDDGRALLNLFNAAGIDASKAPQALAKAVAQLKPGQDLNDLIAQIGAIEDPTLRAQAAMKLFGTRGGPQLAQAFKPGITSLAEFAVSADDAAGATDNAAAAVESGFGDRFRMMMKSAGGALAEFGTSFGDLVMLASAFGPKFTSLIASGIGGLAGIIGPRLLKAVLPRLAALGITMGTATAAAEVTAETAGVVAGQAAVGAAATPAAAAAGTAMGGAMGVAVGVGLAAAAGTGIALAFKAIVLDPGLQQQTREIGKSLDAEISTGVGDLQQSKAALEKGIADINALPLGGFLYGDQVRDLTSQLDSVNAEIARRSEAAAAAIPPAMAAGVASTKPVWDGKVDSIVAFFGTRMSGVTAAARVAGSDGMLAMAAGIAAARKAPLDAFDTLKTMLKDAMTPLKEIARLNGELTSKELRNGLRSGDPAVRAQAVAVARAAADRLGQLAAGGGAAGKAAMAKLDAGIRSKLPDVRAASLAAKNAAIAQMQAAQGPAGAAGSAAAAAFAAALRKRVAAALAGVVADIKRNPAKYADTMGGLSGGTHASGGIARAGQPALFGERGPEIGVPAVDYRILTAEQSIEALRPRAGGGPVTVNVYNPKPEPASTSTRRELRKLALSGSSL